MNVDGGGGNREMTGNNKIETKLRHKHIFFSFLKNGLTLKYMFIKKYNGIEFFYDWMAPSSIPDGTTHKIRNTLIKRWLRIFVF